MIGLSEATKTVFKVLAKIENIEEKVKDIKIDVRDLDKRVISLESSKEIFKSEIENHFLKLQIAFNQNPLLNKSE